MHPVALEEGVLLHLDEDIQVPIRPAAQARLALTGQPDLRARLHPLRDVDRQLLFLLHPALTATGPAGVLDDLAHAVALVAGPLDGEETLLCADLAHAVAGRASDGLGPPSAPDP